MAMRIDVEMALTKSAEAFRDTVWPAISDELGGGSLLPVETVRDAEFATTLDTLAGVDAWQLVTSVGMRPLASRVQSGWGRMDTFTVRWSTRFGGRTEIDKRIDAIRDGFLYPAITVQAYLTCPLLDKCKCSSWQHHDLLSAAWIDTVALYEFVSSWRRTYGDDDDLWKTRDGARVVDGHDGNKFLAIRWDRLADARVFVPSAEDA